MDAVMFDVKVAHLALQRVGRMLARPYGITVARFDLMNALGSKGMLQKDLWKRLEVTRSVVCEMVHALMDLGWVERVRAADSRTWLVMLTALGKALVQRVSDELVDNGEVACWMECGLSRGGLLIDTLAVRERLLWDVAGILEAYRARPAWHGPSLYVNDPEDYYASLTTVEEGTWGDVPFITDVPWEKLESFEILERDA
jgi:DNA-binding MarR family transcriptional regulator